MPWKVSDVDSHKKNLTDREKKQWVRIANSVLKRLLADGKSEKVAAAEAIKQANGVVGANVFSSYRSKEEKYEVKYAIHQEKAHIVVPVVMMVEGVLNGSRGPLLHMAEEFGKAPECWNGIPVMINHPSQNGEFVSANSPELIDKGAVGKTFHTKLEGNKLKAELYIDEDKLNNVSPQVLQDINANKVLEVSVGVFSDEEEEEGEFNGVAYTAIAHNHRPDHLAILTDGQIGACSCEEGCGLGVNSRPQEVHTSISCLNSFGYGVIPLSINEEQGMNEIMELINTEIRKKNTKDSWSYVEDVFPDYFIYSFSDVDERKLYRQDYEIEGGKINLVGSPVEVRRKVEYVLNKLVRTKNKEVEMPNECKPCIKEAVNNLIANSNGRFVEDDRAWLETLDEGQLKKMEPVEKIVEKQVQVNALSDDDKAALAAYKKEQKDRRDLKIQEIQANSSKEAWPDETLNAMSDDTLDRVLNSVRKEEPVVYPGTPRFNSNTASKAPIMMPAVEGDPIK